MNYSYIKAIEYSFPKNIEYNDKDDKLTVKIGIDERPITGENEYASDLAYDAAEKLFYTDVCKKEDIDFLLYCTQSPDYLLPTTACILQDRLGLKTTCGALDFNLGCSGFVYGLSLAKGLIETGQAKNVLLITSETYSKYTNIKDRSVRPLFGDAAAATLVSYTESEQELIGSFVFGTDGSGAENLIVPAGGIKEPLTPDLEIEMEDQFGNVRSKKNLYMNGPEIFNFTLKEIPNSVNGILEKANKSLEDVDFFVFHQANKFMLEHLRRKVKIPKERFSINMLDCGNTVSSTIPIALKREFLNKNIKTDMNVMLLGFGVGYSWAGCMVKVKTL